MGKLFGGGLTTPTGVTQGGTSTLYDTPAEASTAANVASAVPTKMFDPSNVQTDDSGAVQLQPQTTPATTFTPPFMQAAVDPTTGLPNATSPKLTKGGKLLTILTAATKGGLAGAGSWTVGEGFERGNQLPFQTAMQAPALRSARAEAALKESQVQMLPWQRAIMAANLGKTQAEIGKFGAETKASNAKAVLDESDANAKKYLKGEDGIIYDISGSAPVPTPNQQGAFVPADDEMVKVNPNLKPGQPVPVATATKLKTLANSGIETITAGGRVRTVNKATNQVIKDWGQATPMLMYNMNNPLAGTSGVANSGATGEDLLAKLSPKQRTLIKGIANYEIDPNSAKTRGVPAADAIILAKQYNPSYDQTQYGTKSGIRKDFTSGTSSKVIRNLNTATGHLEQLDTAIDALNNSDFPALNKVANNLGFQVGSDKLTNFNAVKNAVVGELSSIYKGTGAATDAEIEHVGQTISSANSPEQLKGFIKQSIHLMGSRLQALQYQYESGIGNPADFEMISPKSQQTFQKYGAPVQLTQKVAPKTTPVVNPLQQKYQDKIPGIVFPQ